MLERISSRRVCKNCGRIYSTVGAAGRRLDLRHLRRRGRAARRRHPEAVAKRLDAYATETQPTIDWYAGTGVLVAVDGLGTLDEVTARLIAAIDARLAG